MKRIDIKKIYAKVYEDIHKSTYKQFGVHDHFQIIDEIACFEVWVQIHNRLYENIKRNLNIKKNKLLIMFEKYDDENLVTADGFDDAIIGVDENDMRVIYSVSKCIGVLMETMSEEDAWEYFNYNVSGAYIGEKTPIWCHDI